MCNDMLSFYLNAKKLDWLKIEKPNPYAFVFDKIHFSLVLLMLLPFALILTLHHQFPCIFITMLFGFLAGFLWIIRAIKTVPADTEQPMSKSMICFNLILLKFLALVLFIKGLSCLTT